MTAAPFDARYDAWAKAEAAVHAAMTCTGPLVYSEVKTLRRRADELWHDLWDEAEDATQPRH